MAPPIPGTPLVSQAGYKSAAISWRKVSNQQGNQGKVHYLVFRNGVQILDIFDNDTMDTGLSDGTSYSYTIASVDQSGTSAQSPAAAVTLPKIVTFLVDGVILTGPGDPSNVVVASPPAIWLRTDGGAGSTFYVKESGVNTSTGWAAK